MRLIAFLALLLLGLMSGQTIRADDAAVTRQQLDGLRGLTVPSDRDAIAALNQRMDAAWSWVRVHRATALPIVKAELAEAVAATTADQFFLLDLGFLTLTEDAASAPLALAAFERLDPDAAIVKANGEELFHFAMKLGASGVAPDRYLAAVDRLFFESAQSITFFRAPHYVDLTPDDVRYFVYGVAGAPGAAHLAEGSEVPATRVRRLRLLSALGSEDNVAAVRQILTTATDDDTVQAAVTFFMQLGGPSGRAAVLALPPDALGAPSRDYLRRILPDVNAVDLAGLTRQLESISHGSVRDRTLRKRLDAMEAHDGEDDQTPPVAIVKSKLPVDDLLAQMKRIRTRSFRRETNHVFDDLTVTNVIINALQYKRAQPKR